MDIMPCMQKQDKDKNPAGYGAFEFSTVLSKVQTGNIGKYK